MAPSRSLRNRKKQTRLEFQPLSSSSVVKNRYSQAIQDRLANVRYEGAGRRDHASVEDEENNAAYYLPSLRSPKAQPDIVVATATSPLSSLQTSPALPPRFAASQDQSSSEDEDDVVITSFKRRRLSTTPDDKTMRSSRSTRQSARLVAQSSPLPSRPSLKSNNGIFSTPVRRSSRLIESSSPSQQSHASINSQRNFSIDIPTLSQRISDIGSAETSENDVMATKPLLNLRPVRQKSPEDSFVVEEDEIDHTSSKSGKKTQVQSSHKRSTGDDFVVGDDEIQYITSEEDIAKPSRSLKRRKVSPPDQPPKSPENRSYRKKQELQADLLDLQDSDQEQIVRQSRTRGGPVTTEHDKTRQHLQILKRRRRDGRKTIDMAGDPDDDQDDAGGEDGRQDSLTESQENEYEVQHDQFIYLDDEDDDFIVEDTTTGGRLGRPSSDIPLQFTSFASAKPRELFPHIVEWMVKNKISPAFNRNDDVYRISMSRIDDQVKAQAGSRLISSAWNAAFKHAILARPGIHVAALPGLDEDNIRTCDACNKTNHPARYDFTFSGKAYSKSNLEPVDESDDDDDDDDDDEIQNSVSRDEEGHVLPSTNVHFYLGRFCAANAEMGHKLTHWKHHLNQQVLDYLEEQGVLSAEAVVSRDKRSRKKREREAESIVDMMQDTGMIAELWQAFQDDLEDARIGMEGHERKGGRSAKRIGSVRVERGNGTVGEWVEGGRFRQVRRVASDSEGE